MDILIIILGAIFIGFILLGIIKKVIKTIFGFILIIALILGGLYLYNTYPTQVKDVSNTIKQVVDNNSVKDYLRVDANDKYYVYVATKDANGKIIYPTGRIFDYPEANISINKIINISNDGFKSMKKQYYVIDKIGNPIVPTGITPPRKFLQPKLNK